MSHTKIVAFAVVLLGQARAQLPVHFEENRGQAADGVELLGRGLSHTLVLTGGEAVLGLGDTDVLRLSFAGANPDAHVCGEAPMPGTASYLRGADPAKWLRGVPVFARARVDDLYPGVDLVYYGNAQRLEFDLEIDPGVDPSGIELQLEGACTVELGADGAATIELGAGVLSLLPPRVTQDIAGVRREIPSAYALVGDGDRLAFVLGAHDPSRTLVIDPVLAVSSYFGTAGSESVYDITTDTAGNVYICGRSSAAGLPLQSPVQGWAGSNDGFVAKLDPGGGVLLYSTYLGGSDIDHVEGIAVGGDGSAYVVGPTSSVNFPVVAAMQPALRGLKDGFVTKLSPAGSSLVYSTYLGGTSDDEARAVAVDALDQAHVVGITTSVDLPLVNPAQPAFGGALDVFVAKLSASGASLVYSTYLGGGSAEAGHSRAGGIAVDQAGNAFATGGTTSTDFPTLNPLQASLLGFSDVFVTRFDPGGVMLFSTYLGGALRDRPYDIAVDTSGNPCLTGWTESGDFPQVAPLQAPLLGNTDAFVTLLAADGSSVLFSTLLGGTGAEEGQGISLDAWDNIHVSGTTLSSDFPVVRAFQPAHGGGGGIPFDAFAIKIVARGAGILWSSYLGGAGDDRSYCSAVDPSGRLWVGGETTGAFPLASPLQPSFGGIRDGFFARIDPVLYLRDVTAPPLLVRGETGVVVGASVENAGANSVQIDPLEWRFRDAAGVDLLGDYTVTPAPGNPTVVVPGGTETLFFTLDVSPTAQLGAVSLDARVTGIDLVTSQEHIDNEADTPGYWDVVGAIPFVRFVDAVPAVVWQGSSGHQVSVAVENYGLHTIDIGAVALTFTGMADRTGEYTVTPAPGNPTSIAGGATELLDFTVGVSPAASVELVTLDASFTGTDAVTGAPVADAGADVTDSWTVFAGEVFVRVVSGPGSVLQGSIGHLVTVLVENQGYNPIAVGGLNLSFTGMADRTAEYTVTPSPGNPTTIAGGVTEFFTLAVDVSPGASAELVTLDASFTGTDAVTGAPRLDGAADVTAVWTVVEGEAFLRTVDAPVTGVLQGSTGHAVSVTVENTGINAITVGAVTLGFTGMADRTAEYTVTPAPGNPTSIAGGATEQLDFTVDVSPAASAELVTIDAGFTGSDAVTGAPRVDAGADVTDAWTVVEGEAFVRVVDTAVTSVLQGSSGHAVSVTVENVGINAITVGAVALSFTGLADRTAEYTVTPAPGNPTTIAGGATEQLDFTVDVSPAASVELVTLDASFTGSDAVTGAPRVDAGADVTDAWTVVEGEAFVRVVDTAVTSVLQGSTGHAVSVTVENTGINAITVGSVALGFTGMADRTAEYTVTPAPGNPTTIAGGATELLAFTIDVSPAASVEQVTLDAGFTGSDAVTGAPRVDGDADVTDAWTVVGGEAFVRTVDALDDTVLTGTAGHVISVTVENTGVNTMTVGAVTLSFTGAADRTAEYAVTPDPGNPTTIAGGATGLFGFSVDVSLSATVEVVTLDASFTGADAVTAAPVAAAGADVTDAWTVVGCIATACGDCNGDGTLSILDSLTAAQAGVAVITLTREAFSNCNVTGILEPLPGAAVDVLDALALAQVAAGLPVTLVCCQ